LQEECGITALGMEQCGVIFFEFDDAVEKHLLEVHVYVASKYEGTITESEEMLPEWYDLNDIPYRFMWVDDVHWFPIMFSGKKFRAHFVFSDFKTMKSFEIQLLPDQ
jgi:8-oxo-dGTP diphosphatase/2-hydroxy-dATP diphosphatase